MSNKFKKSYILLKIENVGGEWLNRILYTELNNNERREHLKNGWLIYETIEGSKADVKDN